MTTGIIAKAYALSNLMGEQIMAQVSQMQASQSFSNVESDFAHDGVIQGEKMASLIGIMQWIQIATIILTPLTLGAGFATAGIGEAVGTAVSLSSAGAQVITGSATGITQACKAGVDSQMDINKTAITAVNKNIKTNFDSIKHESETQLKVGGGIAQMIFNEGQAASQKIRG